MKINLNTEVIGHPFLWKEEIDSTNDELKRLAAAGAAHGTVLCAGYQTNGKGRRGRSWDSPKGDNIYLSILLRPELESVQASMLTLVGALSVAEAIKETTGVECQIKWPNDLVINSRKVCGILTEMSADMNGIRYVIIGIGININRNIFPEEIAHMAASIEKEHGKEEIIPSLLFHFEKNYEVFQKCRNMGPFLMEYNRRLAGLGQQVQIVGGEKTQILTSRGIDEGGALIVEDQQGKIEKIISGEVSVRGLYSYI